VLVEGLVHVTALPNDDYHFDATTHCLRGERSGHRFHLADRVRVTVNRVDIDEKKIDLELVDERKSRQ
jgi:ribonuclease R